MSVTLVTLPPSLLSVLLEGLCYKSIVDLVVLSGDRRLWQRCTQLGGVTALWIDRHASRGCFSLNYSLLSAFPHIRRLVIVDDVDILPDAGWLKLLPKELLELELPSFSYFTRPLEVTDEAYLHAFCGSDDRLEAPVNLSALFPRLRTLKTSNGGSVKIWKKPMVRYFLSHLPSSLTSLDIQWPHSLETRDMELEVLQLTAQFPDLEHFVFRGNSRSPVPLGGFLSSPAQLHGETPLYHQLLPAVHTLVSLRLSTIQNDETIALLLLFTSLRSLDLQLDLLNLSSLLLPAKLTSLKLDAWGWAPTTSPVDLFPTAAELTTVDILVRWSGASPLKFNQLPPNIRRLSVPNSNHIHHFLRPLPPTITHFVAASMIYDMPSLQLHHATQLTHLYLAYVPSAETAEAKNALLPLPPSLTLLSCDGDILLSHIASLPKTLKRISGKLRLDGSDVSEFLECKVLSSEGLKSFVRARFCPHIAPNDFMVRPVCSMDWWQAVVANQTIMENLEVLEPHMMANGLTLLFFEHPDHAQKKIQSTALNRADLIPVPRIPPNLEELTMCTSHRPLVPLLEEHGLVHSANASLPTASSGTAAHVTFVDDAAVQAALARHALPNKLRYLSLIRPEIVFSKENVLIYPLLSQLPRLERLELSSLRGPFLALPQLPETITELSLNYLMSMEPYLSVPSPQANREWLPNLRRLFVAGTALSYRSIANRLPLLDDFYSESLFLHADQQPRFDDDTKELSPNSFLRLYLSRLLPPRMRTRTPSFMVEWNEAAFRQLPSALERLTVSPQVGIEHGTPIDLGACLPPNLLYLNLSSFRGRLQSNGSAYPRSLQYLSVKVSDMKVDEDIGPFLRQLPSTLTHLELMRRSMLSIPADLVPSLPSCLKRLVLRGGLFTLRGSLVTLRGLPSSLTFLFIRLSSFTFTPADCDALDPLPQSLQQLSIETTKMAGRPESLLPSTAFTEYLHSRRPNLTQLIVDDITVVVSASTTSGGPSSDQAMPPHNLIQ